MYQKFWKQFLTEQNAEATYQFVADPGQTVRDVPSPPALRTMAPGERVYNTAKTLALDKMVS